MKQQQKIIVKLKAKHFKNTSFQSSKEGCAIEKSLREIYPDKKINCGVCYLYIDNQSFMVNIKSNRFGYGPGIFAKDKRIAKNSVHNKIIRTIELVRNEQR